VQLPGNILGIDQRAEQLIRRMEEILRDVDSRQGSGTAGGAAAPAVLAKACYAKSGEAESFHRPISNPNPGIA
jgi:hypothetical protein